MMSRDVLVALLDELVTEDSDTMVRQNILGTLQKLSLRRKAQSVMIGQGVISWLHVTLLARAELCEYTIEYAVALLMNLCLRSAGRRFCVAACPGVYIIRCCTIVFCAFVIHSTIFLFSLLNPDIQGENSREIE